MRMKKLTAVLLTTGLLVGNLAGCGNSGGETGNSTDKTESAGGEAAEVSGTEAASGDGNVELKGEVRYAFWDAVQQPYLEECVKEFNTLYPNVKVTLEPNTWTEYWTKLEAGATGGNLPDVFWLNGPNITKYAKGGVLMPIDDFLSKSTLDKSNYPSGLVEMYNIDGAQYALPKDFDTIGVWYNKKIFDDMGVEYPTNDWSWDDMVEKAKQLTKDDGTQFGIVASYETQIGIYNTVPGFGGYVISEDKKSSGYNLPETKQGIQCWVDLQGQKLSPPQSSVDEITGNIQFLSGRAAMYWGGSWMVAQVMDSDIKDTVDVVELPSMKGKKTNVIHGIGNCISKDTKNPEAAWAFTEFLAGEKANLLSAKTGAAIPALSGTAQQWLENYPQFNLQCFIDAAEEYSIPHPGSVNTSEWEQYQADALKRAFSLEVSVDEACKEAAEKIDAVLAAE